MKHAVFILSLLLGLSSLSGRSTPEIDYVRGRFVEKEVFQRVSEYFDETENQGDKIVLRTDPESRDGFYLIISLDDEASRFPAGTRIGLKYIHPDQTGETVKATALPTPIPDASEIWLGLTGDDKPKDGKPLVAYLIVFYSPQGKVFAHYKSYLWEKPEGDGEES